MRRTTLILACCVCLSAAADHPIWVNLRSAYLRLKTLSGLFTETICSEEQGTCTTFEGRFAISLPDRYRLEVTEGQKQLFLSDGTNVWAYLPELRRAIKRPAAGVAPIMAFLEPILDSTSTVEVAKDSSGIYVVKVCPDGDMSAMSDLVLELNETGTQIDGFAFKDGMGQRIHFGFYNQDWNPKLKPELFKFTPPKGVAVER
jgi:outer membrane lipoprotein carrier protein